MNELVPLNQAEQTTLERVKLATYDLEQAKSLADILRLNDIAEALHQCALLSHQNLLAINAAAELKIRVECAGGELLARNPKNAGGRPAQNPLHNDAGYASVPTLKEMGIERNKAVRWQRMARVPESKRETFLKETKERGEELHTSGFLRLAKELERQKKRDQNAELVAQVNPLPPEKFATIVIDPPWDWGDEGDVDQFGRATPTYSTIPIHDMKTDLPVDKMAEDDCHLYLWITNRSLPKGFGLIEAWGFRYITCLTWVKPSFGMGNYFRGSTEQVLFCVRGSLPLLRHDVGTHFCAPRPGKHSGKPNEFYEIVESCSPGPWLEMLAREQRRGWVCWGAEVGNRNPSND